MENLPIIAAAKSATTIVIGPVRFSYPSVFEPSMTPSKVLKYSVCSLIPKTNTAVMGVVNTAVKNAINKAIADNKLTKPQVASKKFKMPARDGDEAVADGERGSEYAGMYFINSSADPNRHKPKVLDANKIEIFDQSEFYAGCWGAVVLNFYGYNTAGNIGVGAGLQHVIKLADDERFGGGIAVDDALDGIDLGSPQEGGELQ